MATTHDLGTALGKLIPEPPKRARLGPAQARAAIAAARGVGYVEVDATTGSGVASPITETADTRVFHDHDITSPDGLLVLEDMVSQTIRGRDAEGNPVVLNLDNPYV